MSQKSKEGKMTTKKPAKSWHWADVEKSDRLKRVINLLKNHRDYTGMLLCNRGSEGKEHKPHFFREGYSAREIAWFAMVNSGPSVLAELRKNGIEIKSKNMKNRDDFKVHKIYWIEK